MDDHGAEGLAVAIDSAQAVRDHGAPSADTSADPLAMTLFDKFIGLPLLAGFTVGGLGGGIVGGALATFAIQFMVAILSLLRSLSSIGPPSEE